MRIALFTDGIQPYVLGGMQRHSFFIAKYLARSGVQVDLYHYNDSNFDISALKVFTDDEKKNINSIVLDFPASDGLPGHYVRQSYRYSKLLYEEYKKRNSKVDFIYTKGFTGWHLIERKKKGEQLPPIGVKLHGLNMFQKPPSFRSKIEQYILRPPAKFVLKHSDYACSYGGKITETLKNIGIPNSRIIELPTGIENELVLKDINPRNEKIRFLYVGRYERLKGVEELGQALVQLLSSDFDFEMTFIGPIPDDKRINHSKVQYLGTISDQDKILAEYRAHDVLICPSYSEGMPNVIIEAMSQGSAIIATNVGAVSALVDNQNGILIENPEVELIKSAMLTLAEMDTNEFQNLKNESLSRIKETFIWEEITAKLVSELQKRV